MTNVRTVTMTPGDQTIGFTREFEAPAGRVFAAHVDPELIPRWIGPRGTEVRMRGLGSQDGRELELCRRRARRRVALPWLVPRGHGPEPDRPDL